MVLTMRPPPCDVVLTCNVVVRIAFSMDTVRTTGLNDEKLGRAHVHVIAHGIENERAKRNEDCVKMPFLHVRATQQFYPPAWHCVVDGFGSLENESARTPSTPSMITSSTSHVIILLDYSNHGRNPRPAYSMDTGHGTCRVLEPWSYSAGTTVRERARAHVVHMQVSVIMPDLLGPFTGGERCMYTVHK